eukprot:7168613-Lingulodinium_polyedra.AAC.1
MIGDAYPTHGTPHLYAACGLTAGCQNFGIGTSPRDGVTWSLNSPCLGCLLWRMPYRQRFCICLRCRAS